MNIYAYYYTLKNLKLEQILYQFFYKIRKTNTKQRHSLYPLSLLQIRSYLSLVDFIIKPKEYLEHNDFLFLNIVQSFEGNWNDEKNGKLWSYNLNYMDYLLQEGITFETGRYWINRFISEIEDNKNGLEPYPIALRGINWIKFISIHHSSIQEEEQRLWDISLFAQYKRLTRNVEYHLLGNHLLEDGFSLLWGAFYFKNIQMYKKASNILQKQLLEQIMKDGAHFEKSPMYHEILLDRLLDCINLMKNNIVFSEQYQLLVLMQEKSKMMLGWLESIIYKDGSIPLLNDAANGIAPSAIELKKYAKRLNLQWEKATLDVCGYRKFDFDGVELIVDVGCIGPDYIPGHAHADTLNYELRVNGKPFIIDSGISTYNKNKRRQYERGTKAHNTVTVDDNDSSRVWGGFRVAERAYITDLEETKSFIRARHDGYKKQGVEHERIFTFHQEGIIVIDSLLPKKGKQGVNRIILHPDIRIISITQNRIVTDTGTIFYKGIDKLNIENGEVAFEYNKLVETKIICFTFTDIMEYKIKGLE